MHIRIQKIKLSKSDLYQFYEERIELLWSHRRNAMNVLLLSDFSEVAINATHYAMDLLKNQKVNFNLLNIYDPDPVSGINGQENKKAITLETLNERVQKLQQRSGNRPHKITGYYSDETLVDAARKFVSERNIDLIVMGSVGHDQRHSTILGKHTFEIISKIKCNTLAVANNSEFKKPEKLLMLLDYTASFDSKNIRFLKDSAVFKETHLNIWEISGDGKNWHERDLAKKEVFNGFMNMKISFSTLEESSIYDRNTWADVQNEFDHVILLGKNIGICNDLLHKRHGLYTSVPNQLPILVLHD